MTTQRLTVAQALIRFLKRQSVSRDGSRQPLFAGCWGIFGHGNLAGVGQALQENPDFPFYLARNEQAMVHAATAYAKMKDRLSVFACTSSIGPGATNMVTGAATATVNRLPVLLLPGDIFARRNVAPVLQQLESEHSQDVSVNDCLRPVSRYWDRINRPDQLPTAMLEAVRVLTSPVETGAVTLALPQDVQSEAYDYPSRLFEERVWHIQRPRADRQLLKIAMDWIESCKRPLIVAGGGVLYSGADQALRQWAEKTGIAVTETQAGKGSLAFDHPLNLGALGVTGTRGANRLAAEADLVIAVGTRLSDFTTASKTAFRHPQVRFININLTGLDAAKHSGLPLLADARTALQDLMEADFKADAGYSAKVKEEKAFWEQENDRLFNLRHDPPVSQSAVIGSVNRAAGDEGVVVCAAGSLPGDLHKLWRTRHRKGYHLEYGYSCMGYEVAGGLGIKMAAPEREVFVMVGDGSYLMMSSEIVTSIQEGRKLIIVVLDNHGFGSIGGLSKSLGSGGFGTDYKQRDPESGQLDGPLLAVDYAANAESLGARVFRANSIEELDRALEQAKQSDRTAAVVIPVDKEKGVPSYETWWDVPVAEVSQIDEVEEARREYEKQRRKERFFL
ncbi:MAG TPA: 3D-(3,5/4)-trihydroxycyclohexane-1,2-dione acylhydrolase (decyclizing) [Acidobacteriota bacterium]|nr:3D-(3,5/4)-trihydroxycyclohexane-1,2-dione acylhydrolase (decyclizing) [Acidobacteriota bacterium]